MTQANSEQQAGAEMPMKVQGADEPGPAPDLTQTAEGVGPQQATQAMPIEVQEVTPPGSTPISPEGQPTGWAIQALGEPHTYREGANLVVMVIANNVAALSSGTGGFAEQAANVKAQEMGLAGRPVIINSSNPFPVNPETLERMKAATKGCKWGKQVTLTTRG